MEFDENLMIQISTVYFRGAIQVMGWRSCAPNSVQLYLCHPKSVVGRIWIFSAIHRIKICQKKSGICLIHGGDEPDT